MKTIFLHIGTPKTGSTTIQKLLSYNRDRLLKLGYFYPFQTFSHGSLVYLAKNDRCPFDLQPKSWQEVHDTIDQSECNNIILSSEGFFNLGLNLQHLENLRQQLDRYYIRIVVFLRRQDLYFDSLYCQHIKTGDISCDIDFYFDWCLQKSKHQYFDCLLAWKDAFGGNENMCVLPFEKSSISNLRETFLHAVGIDWDISWMQNESLNIKPSLDQFRAIKFMNFSFAHYLAYEIPGWHGLSNKFQFSSKIINPFLKYSQGWPSPTHYKILPYDKAYQLLEQCELSNTQIANIFLERSDGQLFYEELEEYKCEDLSVENLSRDKLIDLCYFLKSHQDRRFQEIGDRSFTPEIRRLAECKQADENFAIELGEG